MKTVFISTSPPGKARPDYFHALGNSFTRDGYRVVIIMDGSPKILPEHNTILYKKWPSKRPTSYKDFIFLRALIKKFKPEVLISSFGSVNIMNVCGYLAGINNRVNYILSVSELFNRKSTRLSLLKYNFLKKRKSIVYKKATLLVVNSSGVEKDIKNYYGLKKNFITLPNLIQNTSISYQGKEKRKNQIIIVGNLIKLKGHFYLLRQFAKTIEEYPDLKLLIIGSGLEKDRLLKQVSELDLDKNVKFLGKVAYVKMAQYFSKSLIHISSSLNEAFGFVNIESMREGTPVIATKSAGALDIIKEGENGSFFSLDDINSLTKAIAIVLDNWKDYSDNSKRMFNNLYDLEELIDNHRDCLKAKFS